jgi:hypothetical protein
MNFCPVCGEPTINIDPESASYINVIKKERAKKQLSAFQKLTPFQKRKLIWEISGIILFSGILVTLIIDLVIDSSISWSKYPVAASIILFLNISLIAFFYRNSFLFLSASFVSSSILLILLDLFTGGVKWVMKLGIPLLLGVYIVILVLVIMIKYARYKGLNIIAYSLIAAGFITLFTESFISLYIKEKIILEWSIIVMASILPVSGILLFLYFRLKKKPDLKRFFHI